MILNLFLRLAMFLYLLTLPSLGTSNELNKEPRC